MKVSEIVGKMIIDAAGNEIGKADDLEADWKEGTIDAIIVKGKGSMAAKLDSERLGPLMKKLGLTRPEDLLIPVGDIQSVGKYVVLKKALKAGPG
jgi:sporulation protein YlmC with PRC-barrel domain